MERTCKRCGITQPDSHYYYRAHRNACRECERADQRRRYHNPAPRLSYAERAALRRAAILAELQAKPASVYHLQRAIRSDSRLIKRDLKSLAAAGQVKVIKVSERRVVYALAT